MTKLREQLINIQRKNYRKNLKLVRESLAQSRVIRKYEREYLRYLKDYQEISTKAELIKKILLSDIVYHGDYHTLRQSQRSVLRILSEIFGKRDIILCLEMFHGADQKHIDNFLSGKLPEEGFLKKTNYARHWPFSWDNWKPIILFCRDNHIPILGINCPLEVGIKSLRERDGYSARIIAKTRVQFPEKLVYVVDGDYHVSPNHLPKKTNTLLKQLDVAAKSLIIYQNAENLYWKLCREGKEDADVLKINETSYCIMNTMPANKIQSYLNWLDLAEDAYYPVHGEWKDDAFEGKGITIEEMVKTIASVLGIEFSSEALQKLTVYYPSNLYFMDIISNIPELKHHVRRIKEKINRNEAFLLEYASSGVDTYIIYLVNSSINMAAEEASHFLNAILRGRLKKRLRSFDNFYRNVMTECLGFFGSKFINEKRRPQSEYSIRKFLGRIKHGEFEHIDPVLPDAGRLILQHIYLEKSTREPNDFKEKFFLQYKAQSTLSTIFSTQLGYMLGNKLFYAVKKGKFPLSKIREYFHDPFDAPGKAFECYFDINDRVGKKPLSGAGSVT